MELTEDDVLHILKLIDESKFDYFQLEVGELKITVSKGDPIPLASSPRSAPVSQSPNAVVEAPKATPATPSPQDAASNIAAKAAAEGLLPITAPLLGTFYVAPEPGAPPSCKSAQRITEDTTVGLIEVMKVFNSVRANVKGTVDSGGCPKRPVCRIRADAFSRKTMSVTRVLVANRGEIAVRIIRACQSLGIETVAAVSEADRESLAAKMANRAVCIGPPRSVDSYLKTGTLVAAAQSTGCDALHPGYGFLSERAELAQACADNKITFIGPSAENITNMGDKLEARKIAVSCGVPTVPGSDHAKNAREAAAQAERSVIRCCSRPPLEAVAGDQAGLESQRNAYHFQHRRRRSPGGLRQ